MTISELDNAVATIRALSPEVARDVWRGPPDDAAPARARELAIACGVLVRFLRADPSADISDQYEDEAARALSALAAAVHLLPRADRLHRALVDIDVRSRLQALEVPQPTPADPLQRLLDDGDPERIEDRLATFEDADDICSIAASLEALGRPPWTQPLGHILHRIGQRLREGLDRGSVLSLERRVSDRCRTRNLWFDTTAGSLWTAFLEPNAPPSPARVPALPSRLAASPEHKRRPPGVVTLLLVDPEAGNAYLTGASLELDEAAAVWGDDRQNLGAIAFNAVRAAYFVAAGALVDRGLPPPLTSHRLEIEAAVEIDGDSLALPLALAFYSLWTDQALPRHLGATGSLDSASGNVLNVDPKGLEAKLTTWKRRKQGLDAPLLVPDQGRLPVGVRPVANIWEALTAARLEPAPLSAGAPTDVMHRKQRLEQAIAAARTGDASAEVGTIRGGDPWAMLADHILVLVRSLEQEPHLEATLARGRAAAAQCLLHAGLPEQSYALLEQVPEPLSPELTALRAVFQLSAAIDNPSLPGKELDEELDGMLAGPMHEVLRHLAVGTRGRFRLHRRDDAAVAMLREAVQLAPAYERGRSRIYYAKALRLLTGDLAAAHDQLQEAERDLESHTRRRSAAYSWMTNVFLQYELARLQLASGDPATALSTADTALAATVNLGWWPRLGLLRVKAVALRHQGENGTADAVVQEMSSLPVPDALATLKEQLMAEAAGEASSESIY